MITIPEIVAAFKKSHLFTGLTDEQVFWVAEQFVEESYTEQTALFQVGDLSSAFYFIFKGNVKFFKKVKNQEKYSTMLGTGDFFGESSFIYRSRHSTTARTEGSTILLKLDAKTFKRIEKRIPLLHDRFELLARSHKMAVSQNYSWLSEEEVIYYISRKHNFVLYKHVAIPLLLGVVPMLVLSSSLFTGHMSTAFVAFLFCVAAWLWALWRWLDWSNDYYIITNHRVVWLEKVVGIYDSRLESMLESLLSVNVLTGQMGRWFGFGDVVLRTFTGEIKFTDINNPNYAEAMIKEYWGRTKSAAQETQVEGLRNVVRKKITPAPAPLPSAPKPPPPVAPASKPPKTGLQSPLLFEYFMQIKFQVGNTVTYRKHPVFLIVHSVLPVLAALVVILVPSWAIFEGVLSAGTSLLLFALGAVGVGLWWTYSYVEWANDLYIITEDQIVDIYRKPLGQENRRTAPLENILSIQYERSGIFGIILNYGTVFISVGEVQLTFDNVVDPPTVQQEIIRRMNMRVEKKKEADAVAERERMASWLAAYHDVAQEMGYVEKKFNPE